MAVILLLHVLLCMLYFYAQEFRCVLETHSEPGHQSLPQHNFTDTCQNFKRVSTFLPCALLLGWRAGLRFVSYAMHWCISTGSMWYSSFKNTLEFLVIFRDDCYVKETSIQIPNECKNIEVSVSRDLCMCSQLKVIMICPTCYCTSCCVNAGRWSFCV